MWNETPKQKIVIFVYKNPKKMFILISAICLFFYFLPSILGRNKKNFGAIFTLNLLLGWTFIGWVVALVWALTHDN